MIVQFKARESEEIEESKKSEESEELKKAIEYKLKTDAALPTIELETVVKEELIGGFVLEFDNKLVDASILRDLKDIQKQFRSNIYVKNIR